MNNDYKGKLQVNSWKVSFTMTASQARSLKVVLIAVVLSFFASGFYASILLGVAAAAMIAQNMGEIAATTTRSLGYVFRTMGPVLAGIVAAALSGLAVIGFNVEPSVIFWAPLSATIFALYLSESAYRQS